MIATIVALITSVLEILDQLFGVQIGLNVEAIEVFLAVITPLLVWLAPNIVWKAKYPGE